MKIAVVFDSAGTLMQMHRVAKDMDTGGISFEVSTTELVRLNETNVLIVTSANSLKILDCTQNISVAEFIEKYRIHIFISCSSCPVEEDDAIDAIYNDEKVTVRDLQDVLKLIKEKCRDAFYMGVGLIVDVKKKNIPYVIGTGGHLFTNTEKAIIELKNMGVDTYIASGDSMRNLSNLAGKVNIPLKRVFDVATPKKKEHIVEDLKQKYDKVVMVGDAINDLLAIRAADIGIVSIQQTGKCPPRLCEEADYIIRDIKEVPGILKKVVL